MGENIRNESPSKKHESGAEQGCLGWPTAAVSPFGAAFTTFLHALVLQAANKCHQAKGLLFI